MLDQFILLQWCRVAGGGNRWDGWSIIGRTLELVLQPSLRAPSSSPSSSSGGTSTSWLMEMVLLHRGHRAASWDTHPFTPLNTALCQGSS